MSKSKGNVIDPDEQVKLLGADTVRMYLAFMGPYGELANYAWDMGVLLVSEGSRTGVWSF